MRSFDDILSAKLKESPVFFVTRHYEITHGKAPRGFGSWAFGVRPYSAHDYLEGAIWVHQSRFADAKKSAAVQAKARGIDTLIVLP